MSINIPQFEQDIATLSAQCLALAAQIERQSDRRWADSTGAGYEGTYQAVTDTESPVGGSVTKSQMNNAISALNSVKGAIETASAALSIAAEYQE